MIEPLTRLPDGTIKQVNPITGTKVWTLPGRGARPLGQLSRHPLPIDPDDHDRHCAFCWARMRETTPEIARQSPHGSESQSHLFDLPFDAGHQ